MLIYSLLPELRKTQCYAFGRVKKIKMEEVTIYKFQLEAIKEALRVVANSFDCRGQITCVDRMVVQAEKYAENALNGQKDIEVKYGAK